MIFREIHGSDIPTAVNIADDFGRHFVCYINDVIGYRCCRDRYM